MPHTKSKKSSGAAKAPKLIRTKRAIIEDDDGWAHVVGGRVIRPDASKLKLEKGDFEINGSQYLNKTFGQVAGEYDGFKKAWEQSGAVAELTALLAPFGENRPLKNIVVMGLGSLQTMSAVFNRTSYTQLAALSTIMAAIGVPDMPVALQDPAFTPLDKEFLESLGYQVVDDPLGFGLIDAGTLVYAIHCYPSIYNAVGARDTPLVLIANNLKERGFGPIFNEKFPAIEPLYAQLQSLFPLPKFRNDFSDTVFYCSKDFSRLD